MGTDLFLPPVAAWFDQTLGQPTPVQLQGWPQIAAGNNTLLLAPTGSGKTLAAFLACLDHLWRQDPLPRGIQVLYISPLKALNNDIYRNLQLPLQGVADAALKMGVSLPTIEVALRTGDTPQSERLRLLRRPPHVLITTPESLHLLLTSKARETLRNLRYCIIDEIHALCANKRGVFLSLLLERLENLAPASKLACGFATASLSRGPETIAGSGQVAKPQAELSRSLIRIGLSATQRPLDEVARFLGGLDATGQPRPVAIVDAGLRKNLDLRVISPVEHFGAIPNKTIWPSIYQKVADLIREHRSTIVFANNRRLVERLTIALNEILETDDEERHARAHHGSVALEVRHDTEQALKEGRLAAVVSTASLELGIDMGAVDLVCQVESPGSVARGLQRVGRAGHLVGQQSKGRLLPKTVADLLDQAVLASEMAAGRVEAIQVPQNCLDVLAQQIVAMVAMDDWDVPKLYARIRQAYPFHALSPAVFDAVLEMITGRYQFTVLPEKGITTANPMSAFQPRISWDRVHGRLQALPGSQKLALVHGGTIPDTGQYAVVTRQGQRIGELDEEFVYETRVGDTFLLGTSPWRIDKIDVDRVHVVPAEGHPATVPFWRGERGGRTYDLGLAQGKFLREVASRLDDPGVHDWLERDFFVDRHAAKNLTAYVRRQIVRVGVVPSDRNFLIETSRDPLGDWQVLLLTPLGNRLHFSLRLAFENLLHQRLGYRPQCMHHDDGVLIRLTDIDEPILDLFQGLSADNVESLILDELADSALFAMRFRQNAARALMMPRGAGGKRAPLWLQRLRGRDLLQAASRHSDFPILIETFRECLHDHLDLPHAREVLSQIQTGEIVVETRRLEVPSPFASGLLFAFNANYQYSYDAVETQPGQGYRQLDRELLDDLVGKSGLPLDPQAVQLVERRLRRTGLLPRTAVEMAEWLRRVGDVSESELSGGMREFLRTLVAEGTAQKVMLTGVREPERWILTEEAQQYERAFGPASVADINACGFATENEPLMCLETAAQDSVAKPQVEMTASDARHAAAAFILARFLHTHALVGLADVLARYPFAADWAQRQLETWASSGRVVQIVTRAEFEPVQYSAPENWQQMQRGTLAIRRQEFVPCPPAQFIDFVQRWQYAHPSRRRSGADGLADVLQRLQGLPLPAELWEQTILPTRLEDYQPRWLDEAIAAGAWVFAGREKDVAFWERETLFEKRGPVPENLAPPADALLHLLQERGALFVADIAQRMLLAPGQVRSALWQLLRMGLVTNDHFDLIRRGEETLSEPDPLDRVGRRRTVGPLLRSRGARARAGSRPEGRWSLVPWGHPELEAECIGQARQLLQRYGVAARDLAALDESLPPWRVLYEILNRLELAGEVRRGYFVEGLAGAQFALPEAVQLLQESNLPSRAQEPMMLLHSLDPGNLFGGAGPFPLDLPRRPGNWLVLRAGEPILLIHQNGKRLVPCPGVRDDDLARAVQLLPLILTPAQRRDARHKLTVEEWAEAPVTAGPGRELLEAAGFVRDYQAMTLYATWR